MYSDYGFFFRRRGGEEGGSVAQVYAIISNFEVYLYAIYVYYTSWGRSEGGSVTAQRGAV